MIDMVPYKTQCHDCLILASTSHFFMHSSSFFSHSALTGHTPWSCAPYCCLPYSPYIILLVCCVFFYRPLHSRSSCQGIYSVISFLVIYYYINSTPIVLSKCTQLVKIIHIWITLWHSSIFWGQP